VISANRNSIRSTGCALLAALTLSLTGSVQPASAQGFLDALFGGFQRRAPAPLPPQTSSFADPFGTPSHTRTADSGSFGHGTVYCVRTCDGRYFPLQRHAGASSADLCRSFCPAAKTMVFSGSKIDYAVAQNGTRYADLDNAFAYRDKVVDNCTCNGKDGLGLARVDTATDPTLRPGDIVATADGLATYSSRNKSAEFTPINPSSSEWARKLSEIKVRPAPPMHEISPVANNDDTPRTRRSRQQAARY
jgi:hypothetical protein